MALRRAVWSLGLRYRVNYRAVYGTPDLCFPHSRAAVFCDSSFWHGRNLLEGEIPKTNRDFWVEKLQRNIRRDRQVNEALISDGWEVLRIWNEDILSDAVACAVAVASRIRARPVSGEPVGPLRYSLLQNTWIRDER